MSQRFGLNNIQYTIYSLLIRIVMGGKITSIYTEFQKELKLNQDTIDFAQRLHENLVDKNPFKYESPYLIVAICIFTVCRTAEQPKTLKEIAKVSHIKEEDLRKCYEMVFEEIEASLKRL
ncbi:MAG TPA: cyclin family protein [Nitrosopumilaceae archaeon]|nr:cyclin family protein [Nitrosopumilaceae archaeon]